MRHELKSKHIVMFFFVILLIQVGMHLSFFGRDLTGFHVWRQTQTQSNIQSFAEEDFNILHPRIRERGNGDGIYRMEFPLMQWLTAIPIKLGGQPVLTSRLMTFLFTFFGLVGLFLWIRSVFGSTRTALVSAFAFSFSPVLYYYMINPLPDTLALSLAIWSLYYLDRWKRSYQRGYLVGTLIFICLAALVKLPYLLLYAGFAWLTGFNRDFSFWRKVRLLLTGLVSSLPVIAWYVWVIPDWEGNGILTGILDMTSAQKSAYLYYTWFHIRTTLPELLLGLPLVPIFLAGLLFWFRKGIMKRISWLHYLIVAVLLILLFLFEMNMIETVHDYYFLPLLPIVFLPVAYCIHLITNQKRYRWVYIVVIFLLVLSPVYAGLRINGRWNRTGFNQDLLTYRNELRQAVPDQALVCVGNDASHHIFLYYVNKKGWVFENNWINARILEDMIQEGCLYLYCDSRRVDEDPAISALFGTKIAEYGSVRVYKLKEKK